MYVTVPAPQSTELWVSDIDGGNKAKIAAGESTIGAPQVALKVPFAFPEYYVSHAAYDISRDLSTIVYAHPGGHADLYLLSQK